METGYMWEVLPLFAESGKKKSRDLKAGIKTKDGSANHVCIIYIQGKPAVLRSTGVDRRAR